MPGEPDELGDAPEGNTVCGVPTLWLQNFEKMLDRNQKRNWGKISSVLIAFQRQLDEATDDDGLTSEFLNIDREEKDLTVAYRKKLKLAVSKIDPRLFKQNLELGLRMGNTLAAQQLSNIMALPIEAKAKASDDRPPGIVFEFEEIEDGDFDDIPSSSAEDEFLG